MPAAPSTTRATGALEVSLAALFGDYVDHLGKVLGLWEDRVL
jgi:hypothetical protein